LKTNYLQDFPFGLNQMNWSNNISSIVFHHQNLVNCVADEVPIPEPAQSPQEKLTKFFERRPSLHELEERNILKDPKVAPAVQSAKVLHCKFE
jgi:hypothetical protein